jgi:hypothetical protein
MAYDNPTAPRDDLGDLITSLLGDKGGDAAPTPPQFGGGFFGSAAKNQPAPAPVAPSDPTASPASPPGPSTFDFSQGQNPARSPLAFDPVNKLSAWDIIPRMIGGQSVAGAAAEAKAAAAAQAEHAADPSTGSAAGVPPPPLRPATSHLGDVLDNFLTGGVFRSAREAEYRQQAGNYEARRAYAQGMAITDPQERALYFTNPAAWSEVKKSQQEDKLLKGGETRQSPGGGTYTAPVLGIDNGRNFTQTPTGTTTTGYTGPAVGANGVDARTGRQFPVATSPVIPAGSRPWNVVTPGNAQAGAASTAPSSYSQVGGVQAVPGLDGDLAALGIGAGGAAASASAAPPSGPLGMKGRDYFKKFTGKFEGGLNPADMNGSPTNFGFNQSANPDIDVTKLNPATAAQRFEDTYYKRSGAANLPAPLGIVHADI